MNETSKPLVSIVTPFYNTEKYLGDCIESVLSQTYKNWEYILVNNWSTDKSIDIARRYAKSDSRIRLIHSDKFREQVKNYNYALQQIDEASKYCKIVQADDWIFPECISKMVELSEEYQSIGIVSSYSITEKFVKFTGLHPHKKFIRGKELCKMHLMEDYYVFGSPTSVMFRSDLVRTRKPFYLEDNLYHEDVRTCYEILEECDFGFVHQILTFTRTENESICSRVRGFHGEDLDKFIIVNKYGRRFLTHSEYKKTFKEIKDDYFQYLAHSLFGIRGKEFWEYHNGGLATVGYKLNAVNMAWYVFREIVDILLNPLKSAIRLVRFIKTKLKA